MFHKILVPLDGSGLAEKALPYARALAQKFAADLILVQVIQPLSPPVGPIGEFGALTFDYGPSLAEQEKQARDYLSALRDELRHQSIPVRIAVLTGQLAAEAIVDIAAREEVDLIVKTTHGRSGLSRWLFGSVATKVLQQAPCPVFLIRVGQEGD